MKALCLALPIGRFPVLCLFSLLLLGCSDNKPVTYYTWEGLGPDKWASAWLIHRFVSPGAQIEIVPAGTTLPPSDLTFDFPNAAFKRVEQTTTFEHISSEALKPSPEILRLVGIVHDIEVNFWGETSDPLSDVVEAGFRALQRNTERKAVPQACYYAFFDNVYKAVESSYLPSSPEELLPHSSCFNEALPGTALADSHFVTELPVNEILTALADGKKVAFIDVRESWEFEENHLPKAINVQLRNASTLSSDEFKQYEYVVAYCVKDFRGYEMAKSLKLNGFDNAVILNPYGIKGWTSEGMPIASKAGMNDDAAFEKLVNCALGKSECKKVVEEG